MSKKRSKSQKMSIEQQCEAWMRQSAEKAHPESACEPIELKTHEQYVAYLNLIQEDTKSVIIVQIDGENAGDALLQAAKSTMCPAGERTVNEWYGTFAPNSRAKEYTFLKSDAFFDYLRRLESFYIETNAVPYEFRLTEFGMDDIAFTDHTGELLLYTTTHEGDAYLNRKYFS